jgi:hypothetical protein
MTAQTTKEPPSNNVRKLPLWKSLLEEIIESGVDYGKSYRATYFEQALSCDRDSREFGLAVHNIRVELEKLGYYLQGHVARDGSLVILPPEGNIKVAENVERKIRKNRQRAIGLLVSTKPQSLPFKFRRSHERLVLKMQIRQILENRAGTIHGYLRKKAPKLIEKNGTKSN